MVMHVYFIGIGGTAIGPLALIAHQAGYRVSGSDKQGSAYIDYLKTKGIGDIYIGSDERHIQQLHERRPVDLVVYSSAVSIENPDHAQVRYARSHRVKTAKRDVLLNKIIKENDLKLIAVAGTHGKTTTTAMLVWLFKELDIPAGYSVGAKIPFGEMGHFDKKGEYFIYECDEFDRNFLAFKPFLSLITGIDHDHHEHYPTPEDYRKAFRQFLGQSKFKIVWEEDISTNRLETDENYLVADNLEFSQAILSRLTLPGPANRRDALLAIAAVNKLTGEPPQKLAVIMNEFGGVSRRFERIAKNLYSDYAHTVPKIKGCLELAHEVSSDIVIVYEPLTDRRQHYIKDEYKNLFKGISKLYWVPSYLAREDPKQKVITPQEFIASVEEPADKEAMGLDKNLKQAIQGHLDSGETVVCLSGGGGGSLDEWLRFNFKSLQKD
ncbi:MAG TPA: Mur ligase domain-containing protein [Candidatus Saccharimonadales bacterium]|nr:Mur ligase domain-containing protein [Candidatus Saccharimonadales bacterium]